MKRIMIALVVVLAVALCIYTFLVIRPVPKASAASCSTATLSGTYGGFAWGYNYGTGAYQNTVSNYTFNGAGSVSGLYYTMLKGALSAGTTSGTYSVSSNCIGGMSLTGGATNTFTVVSGGAEVLVLNTSSGLNIILDLKKQ